jgi:hypothetical protein
MPMANRIKEPNGKIKIKGAEFVSFCKWIKNTSDTNQFFGKEKSSIQPHQHVLIPFLQSLVKL